MVADFGSPARTLEELLFTEAPRFDFFQAVRLLQLLFPEREPVGYCADPADEVVRFRADPSLVSPPSAICALEQATTASRPLEMTVSILGLMGCSGVLPRHYTAWVLQQARRTEPEARALEELLNVFSHRLLSLLYRAWEKYRFPISYERSAATGTNDDAFAQYLFSLIGMGTAGLHGRLAIPDHALLFCAGLLTQQRRSAAVLESLLQECFAVPVQVVQCVGQWLSLADDQASRLSDRHTGNTLGVDTVIGSRAWSQQSKFRLRLGPLTLAQFGRLLPVGESFGPLVQLTRFFVGQELDFDLQLVLKRKEVPGCQLGEDDEKTPRLGWSSWLTEGESTVIAEDVIMSVEL